MGGVWVVEGEQRTGTTRWERFLEQGLHACSLSLWLAFPCARLLAPAIFGGPATDWPAGSCGAGAPCWSGTLYSADSNDGCPDHPLSSSPSLSDRRDGAAVATDW